MSADTVSITARGLYSRTSHDISQLVREYGPGVLFYILSALVGDHGHVCYLLSFWYKIPNCPLSYQLYFLMILIYSWLFWFDAVTQHLFIRNVGTRRGGSKT